LKKVLFGAEIRFFGGVLKYHFLGILNGAELRVFKGGKRPFKVVAAIFGNPRP
jgi:hypothetical protein